MEASDLRTTRSYFSYLRTGLIYLNHAAVSPLSQHVVDAMTAHLQRRSGGEVETYFHDLKFIPSLRELLRSFIGAEHADRIGLFGNTSDALNAVVAGLPWAAGDRVLLNDMEFPANVYPYIGVRRHGVEIDTIACPDNCITPEMVESALTPRTRVVALSAVQFLTGFRADLESIGAVCRSKGVLLIVDGIQAVGATSMDVVRMKVDVLAAGAQKWLMGPEGTGYLYLTEEVQERVDQQHIGWLSVKTPWDFRNYEQPLDASARRYEGGTWNVVGLRGMHAALTELAKVGPMVLQDRLRFLTGHLIALLDTIDGVAVISPRDPEFRAGIVTFTVGSSDRAQYIFDVLQRNNIGVSLREGLLRISPHYYNVEDELEKAVAVVAEEMTK